VPEPVTEYEKRLGNSLEIVAREDRAHRAVGSAKVAVVAVGLLMVWLCLSHERVSPYWLFVLAASFFLLAGFHEIVLRAKARAETLADFYRRGIARLQDRWIGFGQTGDRFRDPGHVYSEDLDLFGKGSLFELLSIARLPMGERRLADWLSTPSPLPVIAERQQLVSELRERLDLRENIAVAGTRLRPRLDPESLLLWANDGPALPGPLSRGLVAALAAAICAGIVYYFLASIFWPLAISLLLGLGVRQKLVKRAESTMHGVACNAEGLLAFAKILALLEKESFSSPHLREFTGRLKTSGICASRAIRKLAAVVYWVDGHDSLLGHLAEIPILYSLQVAFAADAWRRRYGRSLQSWVDIAAEMEALLSLACYSFEHPADPFPELQAAPDGAAIFRGEDLGHPLIPAAKCVANSVRLDDRVRVLLVSGSNMSGKSTLLRAVGVNTVLAMAGAPVRAKTLSLTPLALGTRLRSADSLQDGRSGFYTEILRLRVVFDLTANSLPLLFLFDELLEGTNSKDRKLAAEGLTKMLLRRRAIGIVTTHDLSLADIADSLDGKMANMHFEDQVRDGKMSFEYKLRDGVVTKSNAIELMRLIGFEL